MSGWKDWQIGEVVEAAEFQTFLQDQVVQVYADSSARGSALGTAVAEGMVSFTADNNAVEVYNGTDWVGLEGSLNTGTSGFTALSAGTAGISYQPVSHNYFINGAFDVWQRGTSFASGAIQYGADRFQFFRGSIAAGATLSRVASDLDGFTYFARMQRNAGNTNTNVIRIESPLENTSVVGLEGNFATLSFWLRAGADIPAGSVFQAVFGALGGSNFGTTTFSPTTTWTRYTLITSAPISFGTNNLFVRFDARDLTGTAGTNEYWDITGVQLEAGSVATPFKRHAPDVGLEELACKRYYWSFDLDNTSTFGSGFAISTTSVRMNIPCPVQMRANPSIIFTTDYSVRGNGVSHSNFTISNVEAGPSTVHYIATVTGATQNHVYTLVTNNNIQFISELT